MKVTELALPGIILFEPDVFEDDRGYFQEVYHCLKYKEYLPKNTKFVQDNLSYSKYGTIRGLHFQREPYAQAKLVRCVSGRILDVAIDIRKDSAYFGKHISIELTDQNHYQLFLPKGFAHGFSVLSREAIVEYKCDELFKLEYDSGIRYDDMKIGIDWKVDFKDRIISEKDRNLPLLNQLLIRR